MKKSILNLGKTLNKTEQQAINGKGHFRCYCNGKYVGLAISNFMCGYMCASDKPDKPNNPTGNKN